MLQAFHREGYFLPLLTVPSINKTSSDRFQKVLFKSPT